MTAKPTAKQQRELRRLAELTGTSFTPPLARYKTPSGTIRQAGRFRRKGDAQEAILKAMATDPREWSAPSLIEFFERWPRRFPRHPRTEATNVHRIRHYVLRHLPGEGNFPIHEIRRSMLRDVQDTLLAERLSKRTVDHAFASLSALLNDALEDELVDSTPREVLPFARRTRA